MPRVSVQHLADRREQILGAAWRCFDRRGFHGTTMADVITESGLSAGAVYRYFAGKEDLIRATVQLALSSTGERFDQIVDEGPPDLATGVADILHAMQTLWGGDADVSRVALMAWAESLQSDGIRELAGSAQHLLRERLERLARRAQAAGALRPDTDPRAVAQVLLGILIGFVVQRLVVRDVDLTDYAAAVRALLPTGVVAPG